VPGGPVAPDEANGPGEPEPGLVPAEPAHGLAPGGGIRPGGGAPGAGGVPGSSDVPGAGGVPGTDFAASGGSQGGPEPAADGAAGNGQGNGGEQGAGPGAGAAAAPTRKAARAGRNLPAALGVGLGLGAVALVTLLTVKATFLLIIGAAVGIALWELSRAVAARGIRLPAIPVVVGGAAAVVLAYWRGERALLACFAVTVIAVMAWRLPSGAVGYLRDVAAGVFVLAYLPLMASFVALMLAAPDGERRTLVFLVLAVCSDVGGYAVGSLIGRHPMAPAISPKKTWEGFGGSAFACVVAGAITLPTMLHGAAWQGLLLGAAALAAATLGDLSESMIKRDLEIKDMGTVLPGHGGLMDRIDSLLVTAPVAWLLLTVFVPLPR